MKTLLDLKFAYLFLTKELSQLQINFKNSYQSSPAQIVFAVKLSRPGLSPISAQLVFLDTLYNWTISIINQPYFNHLI